MEVRNKNPKVAHIVPVRCLEKTKTNQYHMCLAHLVKQCDEYAAFYKRMSDEGNYVLMDNGAAENNQLSVEELIQCYSKVRPAEIILPDTLLDGYDTIDKAHKSLEALHKYYDGKLPFKTMFVPQAKTVYDWKLCLEQANADDSIEFDTIGVPKCISTYTGDIEARRKCLQAIGAVFGNAKEIHLLGCCENTSIIRNMMRSADLPAVRGIDSAFTYLCSQAGIMIDGDVDRPSGEIDFFAGRDYDSLESNMSGFNKAVGVVNNSLDATWYGEDWRA